MPCARILGDTMEYIRNAEEKDISRIAEILVFNKRINYRSIFQNDAFSFGELQVLKVADEYLRDKELLARTWVYDDEFVKGMIEICGEEVNTFYVDDFFQSSGIGAKLLRFAVDEHGCNFLWTLEKNIRAISFYERNGFHMSGDKKLATGTSEYLVKMSIDCDPRENTIKDLWNCNDEERWIEALEHYYDLLSENQLLLDLELAELESKNVEQMSVKEFYDFLHDKYFVWKYTQKNRLATTRKQLEKYIVDDDMRELDNIKNSIFSDNISDIRACLCSATNIRGLGVAGASGLLSILFPEYFGTVDQFVVKAFETIGGTEISQKVKLMKPENLRIDDGVFLIECMRKKAKQLNEQFDTDIWNPRKIDMILWSFGR